MCLAIHIKVIYCSTSQSKFQCTTQSTEEMKSSGGVFFSTCWEHSGNEIGVEQEWCINGCRGLKVARKKLPRASKPQNFPFQPDLRGCCLQSHYSHSLTQALPSLCWGICFLDKRRGRRSQIFAKWNKSNTSWAAGATKGWKSSFTFCLKMFEPRNTNIPTNMQCSCSLTYWVSIAK